MSSMDEPRGPGLAAARPGGGSVAYRMQSLTYRPVEISLDESVSMMTLLRLFVWGLIASFVVQAVFFVLFVLVFLGSDRSVFSTGLPGQGVLGVGTVLSFVVFWVVLLGSRIDEPIAEWKTLVEDKWAAADSAYAAIYGSLAGRGMPMNAHAVRIRSDVLSPEIVNNRLVITERSYIVYVSVFPYGTSLYVGWTMWRSRRGATLIGHYLKDVIGSLFGRTGPINQMLRTERARAMREAVHAAVREGAEVAINGFEVPIAATFGREVPVEDLRVGTPDWGMNPGSTMPPPYSGT